MHRTLAALLTSLCAALAGAQAPPPDGGMPEGPPPFGPGFGPPGGDMGPGGANAVERKILKRFDKDGNGRLEGAERDAARQELKKSPQPGRGGRGGMRPGDGPPGAGRPGGAGAGNRNEPKPGPKVSPAEARSYPEAPLFAPEVVRTVFLDFDVANWEEELELFHNTDADVPATMTVDGKRYEGVGVHFRGASSYMMVPRGSKRSLNIAVDHTDPKATLLGQNTLNLLNANGDASMMSSVLYAHLARPHIAAPRANFVRVVVNGESWGVFVNVEQFNKAFLREHWPQFEGEGARWKVSGSPRGSGGLDYRGEDLDEYRPRYEIKTKDREKDWAALVDLCEKLSETPIEKLEETLRPILDIDGALWFLALDVATANSDGYWIRASDYSIYRDPKGVFHLVPHDMNEAFKASHGGPGGPGGPGGMRGRGMRPGA
ncbi:MAG: CotH kinase family protein, partial [Planctomycetaceae bacterium]|nr:CotH kinase family protein [Planctomycetaceae bacterium]